MSKIEAELLWSNDWCMAGGAATTVGADRARTGVFVGFASVDRTNSNTAVAFGLSQCIVYRK